MDTEHKCDYFYMYNKLYYYSLKVLHHLEMFEEEASQIEKDNWYVFLEHRMELAKILNKGKKKRKVKEPGHASMQ